MKRSRARARALSLGGQAIALAIDPTGARNPRSVRLTVMGRGLSHTGVAMTEPVAKGDALVDLIALVPHESIESTDVLCAEREARLLQSLHGELGSVRVPGSACVVEVEDIPILVMECMDGFALNPTQGLAYGRTPWDITAEVAAAVHAVPVSKIGWLGGPATRRDHGLESLARVSALESGSRREVHDALAWMEDNLPPDDDARLLHGDLLGQNVLRQLESIDLTVRSLALIDWSGARLGDPAYDLSIVTRGVRRPFKENGGLKKLLEAYREHGGIEITTRQVRFHEVAMLLDWHAASLNRPTGAAEAKSIIQRVPALLARESA